MQLRTVSEKEIKQANFIMDLVCDKKNISREQLQIITRKREIVYARQLCHTLMVKNIPNLTLAEIGTLCGGKDHATVWHAKKTINNEIDTNKIIKEDIEYLQEIINKKLNKIDVMLSKLKLSDPRADETGIGFRVLIKDGMDCMCPKTSLPIEPGTGFQKVKFIHPPCQNKCPFMTLDERKGGGDNQKVYFGVVLSCMETPRFYPLENNPEDLIDKI